jgi:hypothetical protein
MRPGARTPEELETLLEDALLVGDGRALAELFERSAVVAAGNGGEARGIEQIAGLAARMRDRDELYLGDPRRVVQARNTALVIASGGINVARRGEDGTWRYAISLLRNGHHNERNMQ